MRRAQSGRTSHLVVIPRHEHRTRERSAARGRDRYRRLPTDLASTCAPPELKTCFMEETNSVQTSARQLPTVGIDRKLTIESDAGAIPDEFTRGSVTAETQCLEPH